MTSLNEANLVEMFLESLISERGLSKNSVASYLNDLKHFLIHFNLKAVSVLKLTTSDLSIYLSSGEFSKCKSATIARKISTLRQFYLFLLSEKLIAENPALDLEPPKKEVRAPKSLDNNEIEALIQIIEHAKDPTGIRNYCMLELLYSTGMRVSELITLKFSNIKNPVEVHEDYQVFLINGKGNKERIVIFNQRALQALNKYLQVRSGSNDYLFPSTKSSKKPAHLSRQMFFITIKKLALEAGIDPNKVSPHKIRHSFASHILQNGANLRVVQELLGHADISSTQIYTKVLSKQAEDLVFNHHPLSKGSA
ncbi:MAG: tyrosine recombinase XerD [Candidatus Midichloriaceae bacterium]|nr:tyrosine recombinase XerD [Candidatus Midichloriaceae bacterium]